MTTKQNTDDRPIRQDALFAARAATAERRVCDKFFELLIKRANALPPIRVGVVHPCDALSLEGALAARDRGLLVPVLIGPRTKIEAAARASNLSIEGVQVVEAPHSHAAADQAVALARHLKLAALMKGALHTDELMSAAVREGTGLRTERRISHVFVLDVPTYCKPLLITDAAINISPCLDDKRDIIRNAIDLAHAIGIARPKVAILSAVETVDAKIPSTIEAAALCKMADRGQIRRGTRRGRWPSTPPFRLRRLRPRTSRRPWRAMPTFWSRPISKRAIF